MNNFEKLMKISQALNKKYPKGIDPFRIITRLAEETGELAKEVNHFENTGSKIERYGPPDKNHLAKEIQDVLRSALQVAIYYGVEKELIKSIDERLEKLKRKGNFRTKS